MKCEDLIGNLYTFLSLVVYIKEREEGRENRRTNNGIFHSKETQK